MSDRHFDLLSLINIFFFLVFFVGTSQEESNVGCLFSLDLCEPSEFCFDDNAFGRCQSRLDKNQGMKHSLDMETLQLLEQEMRRLYEAGYRWDNDYTQCLVRQILYTSLNKIVYNPGLCSRILSLSKPVLTPEIAMNLEKAMYPEDVALVQFSPNHNFIFAHKTYFPSKFDSEKSNQHNVNKKVSLYLKNLLSRNLEEAKEDVEDQEQPNYDDDQSEASQRYLEFLLNEMSDSQNRQVVDRPESKGENENGEFKTDQNVDTQYDIKTKDKTEPNEEKNDSQVKLRDIPVDGFLPLSQDLEPILINSLDFENDQGSIELDTNPDLADLSFYRQHRYDIKKPGPSFFFHETDSSEMNSNDDKLNQEGPRLYYKKENQLNLQFQGDSYKGTQNRNDNLGKDGQVSEKKVVENKNSGDQVNEKTEEENPPLYTLLDTNGHYEAVDGRHAFLTFEQNIKSFNDGEEYVKRLESLLGLSRGTLSNVRVQNNQITFKVNPNLAKLNASIIAIKAYELKNQLKKETDLDLNASGIGYKEKRGIKITADGLIKEESQQKLTFLTILSCFAVIVALVSGIVLFSIRQNLNLKQRLKNIIGNLGQHEEGIEATLDYEDLCRQQIQIANSKRSDTIEKASAKSNNPINMAKRSQDGKSVDAPSETLSPSRSSTSSWSEEPINSNLDISTGHMILNYMEEYLKNKDRIDKEWEALCAYEADPCSTLAALLPQNLNKNRFTDILPFDHSRVILNDLSNANRSDYINASTITDHDPRSPVYIVTQGPLPSTCSSFWQMIWEQGSVIIVMLTRLMENGLAFSARYWPEEGSQVYSSYEVTLVSEHIWCDDYLVRSFFLKNIRTNETRTVTQFHFLSWPENGIPTNPKSILDFRRKVNKSYRGGSCPIVVHCSDGIGRTGTYCLIDMVLNRLSKGAKEIDIAATLEHIRDQRGGSVKSKLQFKFVFTAIAEEVSAILKTLKP